MSTSPEFLFDDPEMDEEYQVNIRQGLAVPEGFKTRLQYLGGDEPTLREKRATRSNRTCE